MHIPMVRLWAAALPLALAISAPAMAEPASPRTVPSPLQVLPQSAPQAVQPVPGAAPPSNPKVEKPNDKQEPLKPPKKGDTMVELNWSLASTNGSSGTLFEIGIDHVLGDNIQVGLLAGKKWMDYDAQYANIAMHSSGLYLTLSRYWFDGVAVQLRGGAVQDFYGGPQGAIPADFLPQPTPNGSGRAFGVSVVMSSEQLNHAICSWERQYIGGRTVDFFSVSWPLLGGLTVAAMMH